VERRLGLVSRGHEHVRAGSASALESMNRNSEHVVSPARPASLERLRDLAMHLARPKARRLSSKDLGVKRVREANGAPIATAFYLQQRSALGKLQEVGTDQRRQDFGLDWLSQGNELERSALICAKRSQSKLGQLDQARDRYRPPPLPDPTRLRER